MKEESAPVKTRNWKTALVVILLAVFILLGFLWMYDGLGASALRDAVQEARTIGGPITLEELLADAKPWPDDQNGAMVIVALQKRLQNLQNQPGADQLPVFGSGKADELGQRWTEETRQQVQSFLENMKDELAAIDTLRAYEGGRFPLTITEDCVSTLLPHLSPLRNSARLKALAALDRVMSGNPAGLADDVDVILRHVRLVADEPWLVSKLVALACESMAVRTIEEVLALTPLSPSQLDRLTGLLVEPDVFERMRTAIRGERAAFIVAADYFRRTGQLSGAAAPPITRLPGAQGWLMRDEARGIAWFNRLLKADGPAEMIRETQAINLELPRMGKVNFLSRMLFPSATRAMQLHLHYAAEIRCARAALAAEQFRLANGRWPNRLEEVVPTYLDGVPEDPFATAHNLRFTKAGDRLIIYSIGLDQQDNGGRVLPGRNRSNSPDVGFILLDPDARNQPPSSSRPAESDDL